MVGTIIDYSSIKDSMHFVKIASGEKIVTLHVDKFPDVRLGEQVEFDGENYSLLSKGDNHGNRI
jgi:hypothetical protein